MASAPTYRIVARAATAYSGTFDFTPGDIEVVFDKATNIGYSEIVMNVPTMFFTLSQDDPQVLAYSAKASQKIFGYEAGQAPPLHFEVWRDGTQVFGGIGAMETDEGSKDIIVYCYGYAAILYWMLTAWGASYTSKTIKEIVDTEIAAAKAKTNSMLSWITSSTQTPVTTSDGATAITLTSYKASYKRLLFMLRELCAFAASDTTNRVWFDITPGGTFHLYKDEGTSMGQPVFSYPNGNILDFKRYRMPVDMRTKLYGVGSSPTDVALQTSAEDTTLSQTKGLREDSIYLQWVRDSDELSRVTKNRLKLAGRVDNQIALTLAPNSVAPIRASGGLTMMSDYLVTIKKGSVDLSERKLLVGNQVLFVNGREYVRPIFQDVP